MDEGRVAVRAEEGGEGGVEGGGEVGGDGGEVGFEGVEDEGLDLFHVGRVAVGVCR